MVRRNARVVNLALFWIFLTYIIAFFDMETTRYFCMVNINKLNSYYIDNYSSLFRILIIYTYKKQIVMANLILKKTLIVKQRWFFDGTGYVEITTKAPKTYIRCRYSKIPMSNVQYRYFWISIPSYRIPFGSPSSVNDKII